MSLQVRVSDVEDHGVTLKESYIVELEPWEKYSVILWGFRRRKDAEIAREFLSSLPVNWHAPRKQMWKQCATAGYPTRDALMRAVCERLQW